MKEMQLTQGQVALVDDEDFNWLSQWKWCARWSKGTQTYYVIRNITCPDKRSRSVLIHRQILGLEWSDKRQVDHINHNTLDNRRSNLRIVSPSENQWNRRGKGYHYDRRNQKYYAAITVYRKPIYLGCYDTPAAAHSAYLIAKRIYHPTAPIIDTQKGRL